MNNFYVNKLILRNFRNFDSHTFDFHEQLSLVLGNNGRGKTNILEAIFLLSTGRSFRGKLISECVKLGSDVAHIDLEANLSDEPEKLHLSIISKQFGAGNVSGNRYQRNGVKKRKKDVVGVLKSVVFSPEDIDLIIGSTQVRRDFLDQALIQVDDKYEKALLEYEKALRHRNKLILRLRAGEASRKDFYFWDELLIKHGDLLTRQRSRFLHFINTGVVFPLKGKVNYEPSFMTRERLYQYATQEVGAGKTLVGPHRDSFGVSAEFGGQRIDDLSAFGSRGQQRLAVLWLKVSQLQFIEQETRVTPVLLLDDIFSELDNSNRKLIFSLFVNRQVIMTSAEPLEVLPENLRSAQKIYL